MSTPYRGYGPGEQQPGTPGSYSPGAHPPQGGYGASQSQDDYGGPPPQGGYGAPPQGGRGASQSQGGYGGPPPQGGYGGPPPQGGYHHYPQQGGGYDPYPPQPAYGQQGGYPQGYYPPQAGYGQAGPRGYLQGGPVGFGEAITEAFANIFNYQGRASRSAYWWFALFNLLAGIGVLILAVIFAAVKLPAVGILLYVVATIGSILLGLSLGVRRLHDQDKSGVWYLIALVPFVGGIALLVLMLLEGTPGPNRFG